MLEQYHKDSEFYEEYKTHNASYRFINSPFKTVVWKKAINIKALRYQMRNMESLSEYWSKSPSQYTQELPAACQYQSIHTVNAYIEWHF